MKRRIFLAVVLVAVTALLAAFLLHIGVLHRDATDNLWNDLDSDLTCIVLGVEQGGMQYLENLELPERRITWIGADGVVRYDNRTDAVRMGNHGDREEVQAAYLTGSGRAERASETFGERTYYSAERLTDGSVLRLAATEKITADAVKDIIKPFALIVLAVVVVSVLAGEGLSRHIVRPVNELDPEHPTSAVQYPELSKLTEQLRRQNRLIDAQRKQIRSGKSEFDADEFRREFTANVSHELKTPLTAISGTAEILSNGIVRTEDVPHFARNIYREAQRLIALVEDLMRLSQLDENSIVPDRTEVDLHTLAKEVLDRLSDTAEQSGIRIELQGDAAVVNGVERILDEIVYNLCDNALKYNRAGGSVTVRTGVQEGHPYLIVSDTGIGISKIHQSRVFERFYRVDKSHSRQIGGTGLGLSIVKHGVAYHGGVIDLTSEPDRGTTVTVTF